MLKPIIYEKEIKTRKLLDPRGLKMVPLPGL